MLSRPFRLMLSRPFRLDNNLPTHIRENTHFLQGKSLGNCRVPRWISKAVTSTITKQKKGNMSNASSFFKLNGRAFINRLPFCNLKFLNMTAMKNLDFLNSFSYCIILQLTWTFASSQTVLYGPQFTGQYLIENNTIG